MSSMNLAQRTPSSARGAVRAGLAALLVAGCLSPGQSTNPFDPATPVEQQAKSRLSVRVTSAVRFEPGSLSARLVGLSTSGKAIPAITMTARDEGAPAGTAMGLEADLPAGTYRLTVEVPGFKTAERNGLIVALDAPLDAGTIELEVARGTLRGKVLARTPETREPPIDTRVTLIRLVAPFVPTPGTAECQAPEAEAAVPVEMSADGTFVATGLAAGPYIAVAEHPLYIAGQSEKSVEVAPDGDADVGTIVMLTAQNVARLLPQANPDADAAATNVTSSPYPVLELTVPPYYNGMRVSEDPTFENGAQGFVAAMPSLTWTLVGGDGPHEVYVQFRAPNCRTSETYTTRIVQDATAPVPAPPALKGGTTCARASLTTFALSATEPCTSGACAGLWQMRFGLADGFDALPWVPYQPEAAIDLGTDGVKEVRLAVKDRAGNPSATPASAAVTLNSVGPRVATPALALASGATITRSDVVTLVLGVSGASDVELGNAPGLDGSGWQLVPPAGQVTWRLAPGADGPRQVVARFRDACGNVTPEYAVTLELDRRGLLRGGVRLEGAASHEQATVTAELLVGSAYAEAGSTATSVTGSFVLPSLPPGTYRLNFAKAGYVARQVENVTLGEGAEVALPELLLSRARGALSGRVTLQGERAHDGAVVIVVDEGSSAVTDATGAWTIPGLPVGRYQVTASRGAAYRPATTATLHEVVEGGTTEVPELVLEAVPGRVRGRAKLRDRAVHGGVAVQANGFTVGFTSATPPPAITADDGSFELANLTAGSYALALSIPGYRTARVEGVLLPAGGDIDVGEWVLAPATGAVRGNVLLAGEATSAGVSVELRQQGAVRASTFSDASGAYLLPAVPAGDYQLTLSFTGFSTYRVTPVRVLPDETADVAPATLVRQVGRMSLKDVGRATRLTTVQVVGTYPDAVAVRTCERAGGTEPDRFLLDECPWRPVTYGPGSSGFDPVPVDFAPSACPGSAAPAVCDGAKTVWVRAKDASGVESSWYALPVVLDREAPGGYVVIAPLGSPAASDRPADAGAAYTRSATVEVAVYGADDRGHVAAGDEVAGLVEARLFRGPNDPAPVTVAMGDGLRTLPAVALGGSGDGARSLLLQLVDDAGNRSIVDLGAASCPEPRSAALPGACDTVFLDTTAPASLRFSIDPVDASGDLAAGAAYALQPLVRLGVDSTASGRAEDEAVSLLVSNDANFVSSSLVALPGPRAVIDWFLPGADGAKRVYAKARDRAGNESLVFSDEILLDTRPPDAPLLSPVGAWSRERRPTLSFGAVEGASRYQLQLSRSAVFAAADQALDRSLTATSLVPPTDLADGDWYWRVRAVDDAGQVGPWSLVDAFRLDTAAPGAPVLETVPALVARRTVPLSWSAVPDAAGYVVQVDTAATFDTAGLLAATPDLAAWTSPALAEAPWFARARARDAAGNLGPWSNVVPFTVDVTAPAAPVLASPAASALLATANVALSWTAATGAASYVLEIASDSAFATADRHETAATSKTVALADGQWHWRVTAVDAAGNASDAAAAVPRTFTVDTVPPSAPTLTRLPGYVTTRTPTFQWSSAAATGAARYVVRLDDVDQPSITGTSLPAPAPLADGEHTWTVAAVDAAGNASPFAPAQLFTVDATAPDAPSLVAVTPDPGASRRPAFAFSGVAGAASYTVEWDRTASFNGAARAARTVTTTSTGPEADLADGTWHWRVTAVDVAGNVSAPSTVDTFEVDTAAPADGALSSPSEGQILARASVAFAWGAVPGAASYRLDLATSAAFAAFQSEPLQAGTLRSVVLADGSYHARVVALDAAGNASPGAARRSFSVDTTPPDVPVPVTVAALTNDSAPLLQWSSTAASGAVRYVLTLDGVAIPLTTTSHRPAPSLADGSHSFSVVAVDAAGNQSASSPVQVFEVDATAPAIPKGVAVAPNPTNATSVELRWGAVAGADGYTVEWDTTASFNGTDKVSATSTTDRLSAGPLAEGQWFWRVRASDAAGNTSGWAPAELFRVDLTRPVNPTPTAPADDASSTSASVSFTWAAVADASAYLFDLSATSGFTAFERTELTTNQRTLALPEGARWWRVLARDAAGNVSDAAAAPVRKLTVDTVAPAAPVPVSVTTPRSTTPTLAWSAVTDAASYVVTLDGVASSTSATTRPSGALADGTHTWTVLAVDAAGNRSAPSATQSFVLDTTPPTPPVLVAYAPSPTADNTPEVRWQAVADAATYRVEWDTSAGFNSASKATLETAGTASDVGPLANGTWHWRVVALDALGNASAPSVSSSFAVDTSAPAAPTPVAPVNLATTTSAQVAFSWSSVTDAASYRLQVGSDASLATVLFDVAGVAATTQTLTLSDGTYHWRVLATDAAGNQTVPAAATVVRVTVDANAPSTPTLAAVASPTADATPTFAWTDEAASGAAEYVLTLDSTPVTVSGALSYTPSSNLAEGSHTVKVAARDAAGNVGPASAVQAFVVDVTAPGAPTGLSPADVVRTLSAQTLSWSASTDALSAVAYEFQLSRATDFTTLVASATGAATSWSSDLADGTYYWRVRAVDAAGNQSAWAPVAGNRRLRIDTAAPDAPVAYAVGSLVAASPRLQWTDVSASGATVYEVQVDDDAAFGSPVALTSTTPVRATALADGAWSWRVRAVDANGNASAWSTIDAFTLDTTPPAAPTNPAPADGTSTSSASVALSWTAPAGAASYRVEVAYDDSFATLAQQVSTTASPLTLTLPDGRYFWRVFALDAAGNRSAAAGGTGFTVDTTAPRRPTASNPPTWIGAGTTSLTLSWSDEAESGAASYAYVLSSSATFAPATTSSTTAATSVSLAVPADGTWFWRVRATDAVGNASLWSETQLFRVDTINPTHPAQSSPVADAFVRDGVVALAWGASTDVNAVTYALQVGQEPSFTNQVVVSTTTASTSSNQSLSEGEYYWRVRAVDAAGNTSASWTAPNPAIVRRFTIDRTPPDATSFFPFPATVADATPNLGWTGVADATAYFLTIDDSDDFASPVVDLTITGPARASLQNADYGSTPLADGTYYARVSSRDLAGNRSPPSPIVTLTVDTTAPAAPASCALANLAPNARAIRTAPILGWSAVTDAVRYRLERYLCTGPATCAATAAKLIDNIPTNGTQDLTFNYPFGELADGTQHRFVVRAIDTAGNLSSGTTCSVNAAGATVARIDTTPPVAVTLDAATPLSPAGPTSSTSVTVMWNRLEDAENNGECGYRVDLMGSNGALLSSQSVAWGSTFTTGSRTATFSDLVEGNYGARLFALDAAGNTGPAANTAPHTVDMTAPNRPALGTPLGTRAAPLRLGTRTPSLVWSNESQSGAVSYRVKVYAADASGSRASSTPVANEQPSPVGATSHTLATSLADGLYLWTVTATDHAGNEAESDVGAGGGYPFVQVDGTAPATVTSLDFPANSASLRPSDLSLAFTVPLDAARRMYTLEVRSADGSTLVADTTCEPDTLVCRRNGSQVFFYPTLALTNGTTYSWRVRVADDVGNTSGWLPASGVRTFGIDSTPPSGPSVEINGGADFTNAASLSLALEAAGATQMRISVDGTFDTEIWENYTASKTVTIGLPEGRKRVFVVYRDAAGNESTTVSDTITYDVTPPCASAASFRMQGSAGAFTNTPVATLTITCSGGTPTRMQVNCEGGSVSASEEQIPYQRTTTCVLPTGTQGTKSVGIALLDDAGNRRVLDATTGAAQSVVYDSLAPPSPSLGFAAGPPNAVNYACARTDVTGSRDANHLRYEVRTNGGAFTTATVDANGKLQFNLAQDQDNLVEVRAVDQAGNIGEPSAVIVTERSSVLLPTSLTLVRTCAGGKFAILKDLTNAPSVMGFLESDNGENVLFTGLTRVDLMNIDDLLVVPFSGQDGLARRGAASASIASPSDMGAVTDVGCSPREGYTQVLISYYYNTVAADPGFGHMRLATWANPLDLSSTFSFPGGETAAWEESGTNLGLGITSLDVVNWTGLPGASNELQFDAFATVDTLALFFPAQGIRRLRWNGTARTISDLYATDGVSTGQRKFIPVAGTTVGSVAYLENDASGWVLKTRSNSPTGTLTTLHDYDTAGGFLSSTRSPYGLFAQSSHFAHITTTLQSTFAYQVQSTSGGRAQLDFSTAYAYSTVPVTTYDGGTSPSAYTPFFEVGAGTFGWVDSSDARVLRLGTNYGTADSQRLAYPVDRTRPIMSTGRSAAGSAFVVYHSTGLGQPTGVVVGYKDNTGCFNQ